MVFKSSLVKNTLSCFADKGGFLVSRSVCSTCMDRVNKLIRLIRESSQYLSKHLRNRTLESFMVTERKPEILFRRDVVDAICASLDLPMASGHSLTLNIGSGIRSSLTDVIAALRCSFPKTMPKVIHAGIRDGDIPHSQSDVSAAIRELGIQPRLLLKEGLRLLVIQPIPRCCRSVGDPNQAVSSNVAATAFHTATASSGRIPCSVAVVCLRAGGSESARLCSLRKTAAKANSLGKNEPTVVAPNQ